MGLSDCTFLDTRPARHVSVFLGLRQDEAIA
jgi:hypothetical protein